MAQFDNRYAQPSVARTGAAVDVGLRAYMLGGAHKQVMPKLLDWCDEAATTHYTQDAAELHSWAEAHRRLVAEGRRSKVLHPSAAQESFTIPPPRE